MQALIEDFGQYLRHERGQSEHTQKAYCNILNRFADWAKGESIERWNEVTLTHLLGYLQHQREDNNPEPEDELKKRGRPRSESAKLSTASLYLEIAALKAFFRLCAGRISSHQPRREPQPASPMETPAQGIDAHGD